MGHILLTKQGLEIANSVGDIDKVFYNFIDMSISAEKLNDVMYVSSKTAGSNFSYGQWYPAFRNLSWKEFHAHPSLSTIKQSTYQYLMNYNPYCVRPKQLVNDSDFDNIESIFKTEGGFQYPNQPSLYVFDRFSLDKWHCDYYYKNPHDINWSNCKNKFAIKGEPEFLPNQEAINIILKRELRLNNVKFSSTDNFALLFHDKVMRIKPAGGEKNAYCRTIGNEICALNYYHLAHDLSIMEKMKAKDNSERCIWYIVKNGIYQFISFDFESGHFEFLDCNGTHLGEFRFDGTENESADITGGHNLKCLKQWYKKQQIK